MIYIQLFWSFFQIGLFSFGGGLASIPLLQNQVVEVHHWLTLTELTNLITISEMTPGPIAINSATFVGTQIAGVGGALISTIGCVMPSCIIISLLAWLYSKYRQLPVIKGILAGLRPTTVALIACAGLTLIKTAFWGSSASIAPDWIAVALFAMSFVILRKTKQSPIVVMLISGFVGSISYLL